MPIILSVTSLTEKQRKNFSCGVNALDDYLRLFAKGNHHKNIGKTFVAQENDETIGYYTTTMGSVDFKSLPLELRGRIPKYPVPIARIARLAVDLKWQGKGWGEFLVVDALSRIQEASQWVAAFGIVVDAKDEKAKKFYLRFGFVPLVDNHLTLFLPISSLPQES